MTLLELNALIIRLREDQDREYFMTGLICSVLANCNRDPGKQRAYTPQDFMPARKPKREQTVEESLRNMMDWTNVLTVS